MRTPRILLIRADDATHHALRRRLEQRGCRVFEAGDQREAVDLARRIEADLLVQEEDVDLAREPEALDVVLATIEILAGPLPGRPHAGWPSPRWTHPRPRHHRLAAA